MTNSPITVNNLANPTGVQTTTDKQVNLTCYKRNNTQRLTIPTKQILIKHNIQQPSYRVEKPGAVVQIC